MPLGGLLFLSPAAAVFALAALVPLVAFAELLRRDRRVRTVLGMPPPPRGIQATSAASLALVPLLLTLAAMQPVFEHGHKQFERTDAEAYFVFDTSRSMIASDGPRGQTRLQRAERLARDVRSRLPDVPVGIASFTDRVLPHLFPTVDPISFRATLTRSVGIEMPPPAEFYEITATHLGALSALATRNFFSPTARRRLAVVFTDGESEPPGPAAARALRTRGVHILFVHVWGRRERVYTTGTAPEPGYRPDPASGPTLRNFAAASGGRVVEESDPGAMTADAEQFLGRGGQTRTRGTQEFALAPWITLAALLPLGLVLVRRNL